jgi:hypothetical protein
MFKRDLNMNCHGVARTAKPGILAHAGTGSRPTPGQGKSRRLVTA